MSKYSQGQRSPHPTRLSGSPCARPGLQHLFDILLRLRAPSSHIVTADSDRRHNAQLLGNLIQRGIFWKALECIHDSLLVSHTLKLHYGCWNGKSAESPNKEVTRISPRRPRRRTYCSHAPLCEKIGAPLSGNQQPLIRSAPVRPCQGRAVGCPRHRSHE